MQNLNLFTIPNLLTCCNLLCGTLGVMYVFNGNLVTASWLLLLGGVFDFFDGFIARLLKSSSPIGKELDSLADVISFGLLPASMLFRLIQQANGEDWQAYIAFGLIAVFSALRLAKFNIDTRQSESFIGVPTPANGLLVASLPLILTFQPAYQNIVLNSYWLLGYSVVMSYLLVSEIPLFAIKFKHFGWDSNEIKFIFLGLSVLLLLILKFAAVPLIIGLYILLSIANQVMLKNILTTYLLSLTIFGAFAQNKTTLKVQADKVTAEISPNMWGIFFEDINLGADGGMYAELVKNRSFEFFKPLMGWKINGGKSLYGFNIGGEITIINRPEKAVTNPRFVRVKLENNAKGTLGLTNEGFRGMGIKQGLRYDFSVLYKQKTTKAKFYLELVNQKEEIIGSGVFSPTQTGEGWSRGEASFIATATDPKAKFNIWFEGDGVIDLDMISLFPSDTWKGRKGGLRADMVQILADMKPRFVRFPGGCIVEGHDLSVRYQWKKTIGPVENRKLIVNRWNYEFAHRPTPDYFQTFGLGFFEYFQMAEDIGAEPLPILNCGMACQFNSGELAPLTDLDPYIQDALDLIEFANGSPTSKWGKVRASMGHPAPFNLKILGIGNENWGPQYLERLKIFQKKIKAKYPTIELVCSAGAAHEGEMFDFLNKNLREIKADYIDEHYYSRPEWFFANVKRYDNYNRKDPSKIFAGEYAGQSDRTVSVNNQNNWLTALAEAAFMTGLERNGDIVKMASYAPLFGHIDGWQWKPNLIWVDNLKTMATPNYHVQKLYSTNKGTHIVLILNKENQAVTGQDSLYASATIDRKTNELIIKIVNAAKKGQAVEINIEGLNNLAMAAQITALQNSDLGAENTLENPNVISPTEKVIDLKDKTISVELKGYSFSVVKAKY